MKISIPHEKLILTENTNKLVNEELQKAGFKYQSELIHYYDQENRCHVYKWDDAK